MGEERTQATGEEMVAVEETGAALLNVETGELLEATPENAAAVLNAARTMKDRLNDVIAQATAYLAEQSRQRGTKTFPTPAGTISLRGGGESVSYDPHALMDALREAECPEDRIAEAVQEIVSYKVDGRVLRQLVAANPDYKAAAELAEIRTPEKVSASVKA